MRAGGTALEGVIDLLEGCCGAKVFCSRSTIAGMVIELYLVTKLSGSRPTSPLASQRAVEIFGTGKRPGIGDLSSRE